MTPPQRFARVSLPEADGGGWQASRLRLVGPAPLFQTGPGLVFIVVSLVYFPPANVLFRKRFGVSIPLVAKVILGLGVVWFNLGVSDLGDVFD